MIRSPVFQVCIFARRLDRALDSLRSAVGKEDAVHTRYLFKLFRRFDSRHIVIVIRGMDDLVNLIFQRIVVRLIVVTERKHGDTGHEIQIFLSVRVIKVHALSFVKHDLITVVCVKQGLLRLIYIFLHFCAHCFPPSFCLPLFRNRWFYDLHRTAVQLMPADYNFLLPRSAPLSRVSFPYPDPQ